MQQESEAALCNKAAAEATAVLHATAVLEAAAPKAEEDRVQANAAPEVSSTSVMRLCFCRTFHSDFTSSVR